MSQILRINSILNKKLKKYIFFIFFIIILTSVLETLSLASFYPLFDLMISGIETNENNFVKAYYLKFITYLGIEKNFILSFTILLVGILYSLKILILLFCNWHSVNFEFVMRFFLTKKLYKTYLIKDYQSLMKFNSADIIKNIDYEISVFSSGISGLMTILTEGVIFLGILVFLFYFNFEVTFYLSLFFILISVLLQFSYNKTLVNWGSISQNFNKLRIQNFIESFNAIKEIKVFGKESLFYEQMDQFNKKFFNINRKEIFLRNIPRAFLELILIILISIYLIYFSSKTFDLQNQFANIGIYLVAAYRIFPSLNRIIISFQRLKFSKAYIDNISSQIIEIENDNISEIKKKETIKKIKLEKNLELKDCTFFFNDKNNLILDKLNIKFEIGKIYGIKGGSGVGKTTLLNIIAGLIYPKEGSIILDKKEILKKDIKAYQKNLSYVPQNIFLFDASIAENITLNIDYKDDSKNKEIDLLVNHLSLKDKISQLEKGVNTGTGERGINLSGGQIQRIGIARALFHKPNILILDEATNAIETKIEESVLNYLHSIKKDKIIILVAHRDSAFKKCDEIFELQSGKLRSKDLNAR